MQFDPSTQQYKCEYCSSLFSQQALDAMQGDTGSGDSDGTHGREEDGRTEEGAGEGNAVLYSCPSCGAQLVTDETTVASICYYCHTPVVLSGKLKGAYRPDKIIPFALDRKKALEIFDGWIKKKKFTPPDFYNESQIEKMSGVYFPYWLYKCRVEAHMEAEATKLNIWRAGNIEYTRTERYDVSRDGSMDISNASKNALTKANSQLVEGVLPFEMEKLRPFNMDYLAGFVAENRDTEFDDFREQLETEIEDFAKRSLRQEVLGYNSVNVRSQDVRVMNSDCSYALLPVWTLTYKDPKSGKIYYFACNGQTGKVCGELPVDAGQIRLLFLKIFLPVFVVLLVVGYFL